jgi:hypothetical protein
MLFPLPEGEGQGEGKEVIEFGDAVCFLKANKESCFIAAR